MRISVIGGGEIDDATASIAAAVGREVAARGHTLICGGLGGVMAAACRGARANDGETMGILPGTDPDEANEFVQQPIVTGLGDARNLLVVLNGDGVIAVDGGGGTVSELGYAAVYDRPVAGLGTFDLPWIQSVEVPREAVKYVESAVS